jgi:sugar lactone lactonase YvrE
MRKLNVLAGTASLGTLWALAGLLAVFHPSSAAAAQNTPPPVTSIVQFNAAAGELPESMTADEDGNLFVSTVNGVVHEILPDHSVVQIATVPLVGASALTGIKVGPDGLIYVTSSDFTPNEPGSSAVWRITPSTGAAEVFAELDDTGFPNDLAFDDDGNLLVTDPFLGRVYTIDDCGHVSVFLQDPLLVGDPTSQAFPQHAFGVDGIAFDKNKKNLFLGNVDFGRVLKVPLHGRGAPTIQVVVQDPALKGIDGIAVDNSGTVYAAVNTQNRIATVDKQGRIQVVVEGAPLDSPSSFAFGVGHDKHTLFFTNFAIISANTPGATPHPGVLSIPVSTPGAPL